VAGDARDDLVTDGLDAAWHLAEAAEGRAKRVAGVRRRREEELAKAGAPRGALDGEVGEDHERLRPREPSRLERQTSQCVQVADVARRSARHVDGMWLRQAVLPEQCVG